MAIALTPEDVLQIHEILVADFAQSSDPISPPGVRDLGLLESAVARQHVSFGGVHKYRSPIERAATLTYGLCNNHPFHNGNKRTALVAMLVHLDKNEFSLTGSRQTDLYNMIIAVADHRIVEHVRHGRARSKRTSDDEVSAIVEWLTKRAKKPRRGEKQITYRELRRILRRYGFELETPASGRGNLRDVIKTEVKQVGLLRRRNEPVKKRIGSIGYHDEGTFLPLGDIKKVRTLCNLRVEDGIDSDEFYGNEAIVDAFINRYRTILRKLARN